MKGQDLPPFNPFSNPSKKRMDNRSIDERIRQDYGDEEYKKVLRQREIDKAKGDQTPKEFGL